MDEPRCDRCEHEFGDRCMLSYQKYIGDFRRALAGEAPEWCQRRNSYPGTPSWVGTLPKQQNPESLADAHWDYVKAVLEHAGETPENIAKIGFHYRTAMVHGVKHGRNDG
jgi:1,6-anhydro-N-acetylmuramate kinase